MLGLTGVENVQARIASLSGNVTASFSAAAGAEGVQLALNVSPLVRRAGKCVTDRSCGCPKLDVVS